jgi:dephospho-CoA kinase
MFLCMGLLGQSKVRRKETTKYTTPGFYSKALDEAEKLELEEARGIEGIDEEIAILRVKLRELMVANSEKLEIHLKIVNAIARLVTTRYNITKEQKKSLKEAVTRVLTEIAVPLGIRSLIR